jgi:MraZ protein
MVETSDKNGVGGPGGTQGVFVGTFVHSLDPKQRLTIPSEWRDHVGDPASLYVLPGLDEKCLTVFPAREMAQRLQKVRHMSIADAKARQFARVLGSQSQLAPWDTAGRIRIKDELMEFAGLVNQVVLVGQFEGFELWNPERWKTVNSAGVANLREAAQYVGF